MGNFTLLVTALALGFVFSRGGWMPANSGAVLNAWVLRIALPALVLVQIPRISFDSSLLFAAAGPWIVMLGAIAVIIPLSHRLQWSRARTGCVLLTAGLGNTSFMGLPLILALRGESAMGTAVIADQFGSFLALSTLGIIIAASCSGRAISLSAITRRVVYFPPFGALCVALVVGFTPGWPAAVEQVLDRLADTLTPVALFTVGLALRLGDVSRFRAPICCALFWKLALAPVLVLLVGVAFSISRDITAVTILQCAMAPMITAGILAIDSDLEPPLATAIVGSGIVLSLVTVPLWSLLL